MALVTSSSTDSFAFKSAPHPWLKMIPTRVLGDEPALKAGKPSPDPFLLAAKKLKVNPNYCWALEDSQAGTKAALAAGCKVWVLIDRKENHKIEINNTDANPCHITNLTTVLEELNSDIQTN